MWPWNARNENRDKAKCHKQFKDGAGGKGREGSGEGFHVIDTNDNGNNDGKNNVDGGMNEEWMIEWRDEQDDDGEGARKPNCHFHTG